MLTIRIRPAMRAFSSSRIGRFVSLLVAAFAFFCGRAHAQNFTYTTNTDGSLTITDYTGPPGAVTIPNTINNQTVTIIGDGVDSVFANTQVTSVTIPDSVTSIGASAFAHCGSLTSIMIPSGVTSIANFAFFASGLTSVTIPNSVTSIGGSAFYGCSSMINITLGKGLISIGGAAFYGCSSVASVMIPNSVTSIGSGAFNDCTGLTSVTIPDSVTSFGDGAFYGCSSLTSAAIGNGVNSIGTGVFQYCSNLTSVMLGNNVTSIEEYAFYGCRSLINIYFGSNAPTADSTVFGYDTDATIYYFSNTSGWGSTFDGLPTAQITASKPAITIEPLNELVLAGNNVTFSVAAYSAATPSYQWQVSTDGGGTWSNLTDNTTYAGSATDVLSIINATTAQLGYQYQVLLTNSAGTTTTTPVPLIVGNSTARLDWYLNNFTSAQMGNPSIAGDVAEPAGDGIPNLLKYAFNLPALVNGQPLLPQATVNYNFSVLPRLLHMHALVLSFDALQSDLTYAVEASTDLANWSTTGVTEQTNGSQVTASYLLPVNGSAFLRIVVSPGP